MPTKVLNSSLPKGCQVHKYDSYHHILVPFVPSMNFVGLETSSAYAFRSVMFFLERKISENRFCHLGSSRLGLESAARVAARMFRAFYLNLAWTLSTREGGDLAPHSPPTCCPSTAGKCPVTCPLGVHFPDRAGSSARARKYWHLLAKLDKKLHLNRTSTDTREGALAD